MIELLVTLGAAGFFGPGLGAPAAQDGPAALDRPVVATEVEVGAGSGDLEALWRRRLAEPDLARRETHFERLVEDARLDPQLRELLGRWSQDLGEPALAWSARLALRDLARSSDRAPAAGAPPQILGLLEQARSAHLTLEVGPQGVRCQVHHVRAGESITDTFEADSLEALVAKHPELNSLLPGRGMAQGPSAGPGPGGPGGPADTPSPAAEPAPSPQPPAEHPWFARGGEYAPIRTDVLGVFVHALSRAESRAHGLPPGVGLAVEGIQPGTIAASLGLRVGTPLLELNGRPLVVTGDLSAALAERMPEQEVQVLVLDRWGRRRTRCWRPALRTGPEARPGEVRAELPSAAPPAAGGGASGSPRAEPAPPSRRVKPEGDTAGQRP